MPYWKERESISVRLEWLKSCSKVQSQQFFWVQLEREEIVEQVWV